MKKLISLLLVLAMLLSACPAFAVTIYYSLEDFGQAIRRYDDALTERYEVCIAKGIVADMTDDEFKTYALLCAGNAYTFPNKIADRTENGVPYRSITFTPTYRVCHTILKAYRANSTAGLTSEEKQVLETAKAIVAKAKKAGGFLQQELYIHDELIRRVVYESHDSKSREERQRLHSCIGALVDGRANCQGFAEAFWLLGSMLGMEVRLMANVPSSPTPHEWNAIRIDGRWLMVDVTFDDSWSVFDNEEVPHRAFFNFGADMASEVHEWDKGLEPAPISRTSGSDYFYFSGEQPYGSSFSDLNALAKYAYQQRSKSKENKYICTLLLGQNIDNVNDIHKALKTAVKKHKRKTNWYVSYVNNGPHCFITIRWDKF